ncbi:MAG TPA: LysR family transcriptional regulator [Caulobacteraceae bacterium]|nr:LysR family transcriptional regulator [Caulobacteraceae bacterium]
MDLRRLRYFVAVAEEGHVTRASERLGMAQAPLSQQIKTLERELGAQLFRRRPRGVELTDAGAALLVEARAILARIVDAEAMVRRAARGEEGRVRIGFTSSACFHPATSAAIRALRDAAPQVALSFDQAGTPVLIARLQAGDVDAVLIRTAASRPEGVALHRLADEPMIAALPADHPLATAPALALTELAGETFVAYPRAEGAGLYDAIIAACHGAGFSPHVGHETPQMIATLSLVAAGLGVSLVPASLTRMRLDGVAYRPLLGEPPHAQLNLAVRRGETSTAVRRFVEVATRTST